MKTRKPLASPARFFGHTENARRIGAFLVSQNRYAPKLELPQHAHRRAYISFVITGTYDEVCGRRRTTCSQGTLVFHPCGEEHSDIFESQGAIVLSIDVYEGARLTGRSHRLNTPGFVLPGPETSVALQICREFGTSCPVSDLIVESLAFELLSTCCGYMRSRGMPKWLAAALQLANDRYADHLTLAEVASAVGVHPVHLARQFRDRMECTFGEFLRRIRISRALDQLRRTDKPIVEIAIENGFADQSHLTRLMSEAVGIPPAAYRSSSPRYAPTKTVRLTRF